MENEGFRMDAIKVVATFQVSILSNGVRGVLEIFPSFRRNTWF